MTECVKAYAKINLHLDITGILPDKYHAVRTVMQSISLYDNVSVTLTGEKEFFAECNVDGVPTDDKNIAVRAARIFAQECEYSGGARITIEKKIPMAAGMAGGSADAAATLLCMNTLLCEPFTEEKLLEIGARLGADVPFCIRCGTAYADGKGDILHGFPGLPEDIIIVAACGGEGVSTPQAYGLLDSVFNCFEGYEPRPTEPLAASLESSDKYAFCKELFNIFEAPIMKIRPVVSQIKGAMLEEGASRAMMSGSGPSVFGVFKEKESAERAALKIKEMGYFAQLCSPVSKR